jgi:hypothetical protein
MSTSQTDAKPLFQIHAPGYDVEKLVQEIEATVTRKMAAGEYDDAAVARAERTNLANMQNHDEFLAFYINCLRESAFVDISDFEIRERRRGLAPLLVRLKKTIWGLLKFYTYRLWSQQNQVNGLLVTAVDNLDQKYRAKIKALEKRLAELEARTHRES